MGGHGGLNILPQKRWNVYNYDNREKVRKDEEAAAKEEQLKREQSRKRDTDFRLQLLRLARGLPSSSSSTQAQPPQQSQEALPNSSNHINLFEGIRVFDPIKGDAADTKDTDDNKWGKFKKLKREMVKKESEKKVVLPEDEKYKLGYGLVGKGVKLPWYVAKKNPVNDDDDEEEDEDVEEKKKKKSNNGGKKTVAELREERLKRERMEKERARALLTGKGPRDGPAYKDRYFTRA